MVVNRRWTRSELLAALNMYCQLPFGRLHASNPAIIQLAHAMERSPAALAMKLVNIASLDPQNHLHRPQWAAEYLLSRPPDVGRDARRLGAVRY